MRVHINELIEAFKNDNADFLMEFHLNILNMVNNPGDNTFLHTACIHNNLVAAEHLLKNGADSDLLNAENDTPIWSAYKYNHPDIFNLLIKYKADINSYGPNGYTLLQDAMKNAKWNFVKLLLEQEKDIYINKPTEGSENIPTIFFLIDGICNDPNNITNESEGITFLEQLITSNKLDLNLEYIDNSNESVFQRLLTINSSKLLEILIKNNNFDINKRNKNGITILISYVKNNNIHNIDLLHKTGRLDLNIPDNKSWTPIRWSISLHNFEMLKHLVSLGATVTPNLIPLIINQCLSSIKDNDDILINNNFYNNAIEFLCSLIKEPIKNDNYKCCTLLHHACLHGWTNIVKKILENKINIDLSCDGNIKSPLCRGCGKHHSSNEEHNTSNNLISHRTPLYQATVNGHNDIVNILLDAGADIKKSSLNLDLTNPEYPIDSYEPYIIRGLIDVSKPLNRYSQYLQKSICLYKRLNKNKVELISHLPVNTISNKLFILLDNGIVWNIENLVSYIIKVTNGINEYDSNAKLIDPAFTGEIFSPNDSEKIFSFQPFGQKLKNFLTVLQVNSNIDPQFINLIDKVGSILWSRGLHFEERLRNILTQTEYNLWHSSWKFGLRDDAMPSMPSSISTSIEIDKQLFLTDLYRAYDKLNDAQKKAFSAIYVDKNKSFEKRLDQVCRAQFCVMTFGSFLVKTAKCYHEYTSVQLPPVPINKKELLLPVLEPIQSVMPSLESVMPSLEPVMPSLEPVMPTMEPVMPTMEPVMPTVEPVMPTMEPVMPTMEPVMPTMEPVMPTMEPVMQIMEPVMKQKLPVLEPVQPLIL